MYLYNKAVFLNRVYYGFLVARGVNNLIAGWTPASCYHSSFSSKQTDSVMKPNPVQGLVPTLRFNSLCVSPWIPVCAFQLFVFHFPLFFILAFPSHFILLCCSTFLSLKSLLKLLSAKSPDISVVRLSCNPVILPWFWSLSFSADIVSVALLRPFTPLFHIHLLASKGVNL